VHCLAEERPSLPLNQTGDQKNGVRMCAHTGVNYALTKEK
jgi:hypothetical protein